MSREKPGFGQTHHHLGRIVHALEEQGSKNTSFAVVAISSDGDVQVHASQAVRGFLDENLFSSKFGEAHMLSLQQACAMPSPDSSPERFPTVQGTRPVQLIENEKMQEQRPYSRATSRSLSRTARQRRWSTLMRDVSPVMSPYPEPREDKTVLIAEDQDSIVKPKVTKSFRIDSKADVTAYLASRLKRLQQLAGKKIAKAWIKGICPKKQARFPYQNKKRIKEIGELPRVPGWWPQQAGVCRFIEPDHIRREERMQLCLHLLRLRPTPQQLRTWNDDTTEYNKTHVVSGWTAFLRELAGPDLFDDLPKEAPNRVKLRETLLAQMYDVAALEEQFENGEIDGETLQICEVDAEQERRPSCSKRSRRSSTSSSVGEDSRRSSISTSSNRAKRLRQNSEHTLGQKNSGFEPDPEMVENSGFDHGPLSQWTMRQDRSRYTVTDPMTSVAPPNDVSTPTNHVQSPWISVQPQIQHFQASTAPSRDTGFAPSDPPTSMISRKRALKAQRRMQADQFSDSFRVVPVKQEAEPMMPLPQDQMQPWQASSGYGWANPASPFCSPQTDPNTTSGAYVHPPLVFSEPQGYNVQQYTSNTVDPAPQHPMSSSQMFPAQNLQQPDMTMHPTYCMKVDHGTPPTAMPMPCDEFLLPTGQLISTIDLQQPSPHDSWQHQGIPERHVQANHGMPEFFYPGPLALWDNRC